MRALGPHVMVAVAVDEPPPPRSLVLGALASLVNALRRGQSERSVCVSVLYYTV